MLKLKKLLLIAFVIILSAGFGVGCGSNKPRHIKNVILLIGDGMGQPHIRAAAEFAGVEKLYMETIGFTGSVITDSLDDWATDSAAAATAMATGTKVNNTNVSMLDGVPLKKITDIAKAAGRSVGIVTTDDITAATPAAFMSHAPTRYDTDAIIENAIEVDVVFGNVMSLKNSVQEALEILCRNKNGFFLMAEEDPSIDGASHNQDMAAAIQGVLAFDEAVKVAVEWAKKRKDTIVIVTADHGTSWETGNHTPDPVSIFIYGLNLNKSEIDNTEIFIICKMYFI